MRPVAPHGLERGECALPASAAHQAARPAARDVGGAEVPSTRASARSHRSTVSVMLLHVHHRIGEARAATSMSPMSCMSDEAVRMRVAVGAGKRGADFLQRVRAERRERQEPADREHAARSRRTRAAGRSPIAAPELLQTRSTVTPASGSVLMSPQTNSGATCRAARERCREQPAQAASVRAGRAPLQPRPSGNATSSAITRAPGVARGRARRRPRPCRSPRRGWCAAQP